MFWRSSEPSARGEEFHYDCSCLGCGHARTRPRLLTRSRASTSAASSLAAAARTRGPRRPFGPRLSFVTMVRQAFHGPTWFVGRHYQSYPREVTRPIPGLEYRSITGSFA